MDSGWDDRGDEGGRSALVARWLELTRVVLPGMAATQAWPIRLDHCFMRVFLDHATGGRWDGIVARPAVRNMPIEALRRAVAAAEAVVLDPALLPALDEASLAYRGRRRVLRAGPGGRAASGRVRGGGTAPAELRAINDGSRGGP